MSEKILYMPDGSKYVIPPPISSEQPLLEKLKGKEPQGFEKLASELGLGVDVVTGLIDGLKDKGYGFAYDAESVVKSISPEPQTIFDATKILPDVNFQFGVVSDTHLCSKKERLDALEKMYDTFEKEGVSVVWHVGDVTDGYNVYRGQEFEVKMFGQDEQVDYAVANYPKRKGINTYYILGNHDLRQYETGGIDIGKPISQRRDDMKYLGQATAKAILANGVEMELLHPAGTGAYALSYKAQRHINNLAPKDVPDILLFGHYHSSFYMKYRDVNFLQVPCFKDSGIFEKRLGLNPTIGGWLVNGHITGEGSIDNFKPQLFTY